MGNRGAEWLLTEIRHQYQSGSAHPNDTLLPPAAGDGACRRAGYLFRPAERRDGRAGLRLAAHRRIAQALGVCTERDVRNTRDAAAYAPVTLRHQSMLTCRFIPPRSPRTGGVPRTFASVAERSRWAIHRTLRLRRLWAARWSAVQTAFSPLRLRCVRCGGVRRIGAHRCRTAATRMNAGTVMDIPFVCAGHGQHPLRRRLPRWI
jgi:hypothetical protein